MRAAGAGLIAYLGAGELGTVRHLITVTPLVGSVVRWTDHTSDLVVGGYTFRAGGEGTMYPIPIIGTRDEKAGTEIGRLTLTLMCGSAALFNGVLLPLAVVRKTLEGAVVKVERVYMPTVGDVSLGAMHLFEGLWGEPSVSESVVEVDIESGLAALNVDLPRHIFQPGCSNMLYDAQCAVSKAGLTVTGTVGSSSTTTAVTSNRAEAADYFRLGAVTFTSGACSGETRAVRAYTPTAGTFTMDRPLPVAPSNGDTFSAYPGCDRQYATCGTKFSNTARFRAEPFVPRNEAAL